MVSYLTFLSTEWNSDSLKLTTAISPLLLSLKRLCHLSDVDECETGVCAEECLNTLGSFRCFCDGRQGMKLSQDLRSCKVKYINCGRCSTNQRFHISPSECGYM